MHASIYKKIKTMKYLKKFFTQNEYGEFVESDKFIKPHVSYITENKKVNFHKKPK